MKTARLLILTTMFFASKVSGQKGNFCYECQGLCGQGHENQNPCCSGDLSAIKKAKVFDSEKIKIKGYLNSTTTQTYKAIAIAPKFTNLSLKNCHSSINNLCLTKFQQLDNNQYKIDRMCYSENDMKSKLQKIGKNIQKHGEGRTNLYCICQGQLCNNHIDFYGNDCRVSLMQRIREFFVRIVYGKNDQRSYLNRSWVTPGGDGCDFR